MPLALVEPRLWTKGCCTWQVVALLVTPSFCGSTHLPPTAAVAVHLQGLEAAGLLLGVEAAGLLQGLEAAGLLLVLSRAAAAALQSTSAKMQPGTSAFSTGMPVLPKIQQQSLLCGQRSAWEPIWRILHSSTLMGTTCSKAHSPTHGPSKPAET